MKSAGRVAYEAYGDHMDWKTFDGRDMPEWDEVGTEIQAAWGVATAAVLEATFEPNGDME